MVRHIIAWSIVLAASFPSVSCRKQPPSAPTPNTPKAAETSSSRAGLRITPLSGGRNEIADIVGIHLWHFRLACDVPDATVLHSIDLRDAAQQVKQIACGVSRWPQNSRAEQMTVALYPLDGDLRTSDKLKTYVRAGSATFSSVGDNPMKGRQRVTALATANRQEDGSFLLVQSPASGLEREGNALQLVLKISLSQAQDTPPPQ